MKTTNVLRALGAVSVSLVLASCGGGGGDGATSTSTSPTGTAASTAATDGRAPPSNSSAARMQSAVVGVAVGPVTGFGSVIVDGTRFDMTDAQVEEEVEPGVPQKMQARDLRLGQLATVEFGGDVANAKALSVKIDGEIVGVVDSVDAAKGRLTVSGQDVRTNVDAAAGPVTIFDGFKALADVKVGNRIEVHGLAKVDAATNKIYVQATRIEHKADSVQFVRVTGTVANLAATTFDLGTLKVSFNAATRMIPADAKLANGDRVVVYSDAAVSNNTVTAKALRVKGQLPVGLIWLSGAVSDCVGACIANFKVNGLAIDASKAVLVKGVAADLKNGAFVRVRGSVDSATAKVAATHLIFKSNDELELDVRGLIAGYVAGANGASTFNVRGVPIQTNAQTKLDDCPAALANDIPVKVEGNVGGNVLVASKVKCVDSLDAMRAEVRGAIGSVDAAGKTFKLANYPDLKIAYDPAKTEFEGGAVAQLVVGASVEVEGPVKDGTLTASEIEFKRAPGANEREIKGIVFEYNAQAGTFKIGMTTITIGSAALPAGFANGVLVEVDVITAGTTNSTTNIATRIEVKK